MDAKEKLLFKEKYDEVGYEDIELEACYELIEELPIDADELIEELEEWYSIEGDYAFNICLDLNENILLDDWNGFFSDLDEFLQTNIKSLTKYVQSDYKGLSIEEALENQDIIENFLNDTIILGIYELITEDSLKELQSKLSIYLLEEFSDEYIQTENYLCIKNFKYTVASI